VLFVESIKDAKPVSIPEAIPKKEAEVLQLQGNEIAKPKSQFPEFPGKKKTKAETTKLAIESEINPPSPRPEDFAFAPNDFSHIPPFEPEGFHPGCRHRAAGPIVPGR
jgi:hypothetical protein